MSLSNQLLNFPLKLNFFFGNIAFITLFIAVLLYWFDFLDNRVLSKKLKIICMVGANVSLTFLLMLRWFESGHFPLSNLYESLIGLSWGFTSIHLILIFNPMEAFNKITTTKTNFLEIEHKKLKGDIKIQKTKDSNESFSRTNTTICLQSNNLSESVLFVPGLTSYWNKSLAFPISENKQITSTKKDKDQKLDHISSQIAPKTKDIIGAIIAPTALLTNVFATFFLPPEITRASALIPALKSNWLTMHVTVMVASYAFLLIGSLLSITFCVYQISNKTKEKYSLQSNISFIPELNVKNSIKFSLKQKTLESFDNKKDDVVLTSMDINNFNFATWLNNTSYRILGLGFPLLTIGILSGAVWANEAWGSYWSWDPKETWALITWLVFAVYFHSRYTRSSDSLVPAIIASVGFLVIWICYLGVNLLGTGLHSYGWFSS